ncbi:PKD domain-containing protein [Marinifilum sp. RC60d5]|uniref:PKD domain-containing protein n=1 Tax=Marinifilum sp. RC60d5 TaxID=3458414 RepID=UPI00403669FD
MIPFYSKQIKRILKSVIILLTLFTSFNAYAEDPPNCDFGDEDGYFYHWDFSAEKLEFKFELKNLTEESIANNISEYTIDWGDGSATETVAPKKFPLKHTYSTQDQFNLIITVTYLGKKYSYKYIVYNTVPDAVIEKIEGDNGCTGQKFVFILKNYKNNPPATTYRWTFGDDSTPIIWDYNDIIDNSSIIDHTYTKTSCDFEGDEDHFATTVSPRIRIDGNNLKGFGVSVNDITISKDINLNLDLSINGENKIITDNHTGCINNTLFYFKNDSYYGLDNAFCEATTDHEWIVTKYEEGTEVGNAELGTEYYFKKGDENSKEDISIIFLETGTYKITFHLANACSSSEVTTGEISIYENENTTTYTPDAYCLADNETVSFTTTEDPEIEAIQETIYSWTTSSGDYEFVEETDKHSQNPKIKFKEAGKHTVYLEKTSLCGTENYEYIVEVSDVPVVSINMPDDLSEGGYCGTYTYSPTASFTDNGKETFKIEDNEIDEYKWTFDNNGTITSSTNREPGAITFDKYGKSSISLQAHNNCGWSEIDKIEFEIYEIPTPVIDRIDQACQEEEISYTAQPDDMASYQWTFGDGTSNNTQECKHTFSSSGTFTDKLTVTSSDGCSNSIEKEIEIIAKPSVNAGANLSICNSDTSFEINDANAKDYLSIKWTTTGDGTFSDDKILQPTYTLGTEDHTKSSIELTLTVQGNGTCGEEISTKTINITPIPTISFDKTSDKICQYSTYEIKGVNVENESSVEWTANKSGTFENKNANETSFTPSSDFSGTVILTLTAFGNGSCAETQESFSLTVVKQPTVKAVADSQICEGEDINLNGTSSSSVVKWLSDGDGIFSNENALTGTYTPGSKDIENGSVNLELQALGKAPCEISDFTNVEIFKKPSANAGADDSMCKTVSSYTIITGSNADMAKANNYSSISWTSSGTGTFTDNTILNATYTPSKKDLEDGSVELILEAKANGACSQSATDKMILTLTDIPVVEAGDDITSCQASQINLSATAKNHSSVLWTTSGKGIFSDPTQLITSYQPDPDETGNYTLTLTATSTGSCDDVFDELQITIIGKVKANAGNDGEVCSNGTYNLSDGESGASTYSASEYEWTSEGDGTFDNPKNINANYTPGSSDITNGSVKLTLTAQPEAPCSEEHSDSMILTITKSPTANTGENKAICQGESFNMENASTQNSSSLKWETSSSDGFFENETSLNATYHPGKDDTGKYTLSLIAYGEGSCSFTKDEMELDITPAPTVSIEDKASICEDGNYTIQNAHVNNSPGYTWKTSGLGTLTNTDDLTPTYQTAENETGDITISITAEGNGKCGSISAPTTISIIPHPFIDAGDDDEVCSNQTYAMNIGSEMGQINAKSWSSIEYNSSGDGDFINQDGLQATYIPGDNDKINGEVNISIKANSISPCNEFAKDIMTLKITPAPEINAGADDKICEGDSYELINATQQNTSELIWTSSDGGSFSNANILQTVYTPETGKTGNVTLQLTGKGNGSCIEKSSLMSLQIVPVPKVKAGDDASICFNKNYDLTSTIASSFSTILWTTSGSGTFSNASELHPTYLPSKEDYESGKVTLTITVQGLTPCLLEDSDELELQFIEAPFVFAGNDDEICEENGKYTIKEKSAENPTGAEINGVSSYLWETNGKGSLQNSNTITPTYIPAENETGVIQITLKAVGFSNCDNTEDTMELTIIPTPEADFSIGTSCIESTVAFSDKSDGKMYSIEKWSWNFGDESVSEEQNTDHEFTELKDYTVTLSVTNNKGCSSSIEKTASIHPLPEVKFSHDTYAAIDIPTKFINESTNAVSYLWNFGDESTSSEIDPSHTYVTENVFNVLLEAESADGCFNSYSSTIEVIGKPEAGFTKTPDGCGPLSVEFTNTSKGEYLNYFWDFGNGITSLEQSPKPVTFEPGKLADTTYTVVLKIENKAGVSSFTDYVVVKPLPIPAFEILPTSYGCSPVVRSIYNYSKGLPDKYSFDFGDDETYEYESKDIERPFEHTFFTGDTKTIYPINLTASNECGDRSITKNMTVFPNTAVAVFKADQMEGCAPLTVAFENLSKGAGDYLESDWIFENGEVDIRDTKGETVYHTFEKAGVYEVQLSVHDTCASDITTQKITVVSAPEIDFEIKMDNLCDQEQVYLSVSEDTKSMFTNFTWDMGDGNSKTGAEITHKYTSAQIFTIQLSAIYLDNGCEKSVSKKIEINKKPKAEFAISNIEGCEPLNVSFTNNSADSDFYQWNFNDGAKSTKENPEHTFSTGDYEVSLITETEEGCLDTITMNVLVHPTPIAEFSISNKTACSAPFSLAVTNTTANKELNSYTWDFDNGTISNATNPTEETFNDYGDFSISLIAENQFLCADTSVLEFNIYKKPIPAYQIISKTTCEGEVIEFQDLSENSLQTYWEFSDGFTTEGKSASHIFTSYGQYNLHLKTVGEGNCADSILEKKAIKIYPIPVADFSWENINTLPEGVEIDEGETLPNNGTVQFNNLSDEFNDDWIAEQWCNYKWDFDDLNSSYEKSPVHKYTNNGDFYVTLFTESPYSCKDSITKTVEVDLMSGLFVPNAFNPGNPDPQVSLFLPKGIGLFKYHIEILDSWGNFIWESEKIEEGRPAEGWDGTKDGEVMPQGVYIWKIRAVFKNGVSWQGMKINGKYYREGSVTLIQ